MPDRQLKFQLPLTASEVESISNSISKPRLGKYLRAVGFNKNKAIDLYRWNAFVGECIHFPIQATEISLRNTINECLHTEYGKRWFEHAVFIDVLDHERMNDIEVALKRLRNRIEEFNCDDVVATLSFGFWAYLLQPRYFQPIWRKYLRTAFAFLPNGRAHKSVHLRAGEILDLRNRVAHHEPLIDRDLSKEHTNIIEFIRWISPEKAEWVRAHSFVQAALRQRP